MRELSCTPSELRREKVADIFRVLTCLDVEAEVMKLRKGRRA